MRIVVLAAIVIGAGSGAHAVTPVPARTFVRHPSHAFDLSHKRILFTPHPGGYNVQVTKSPGPFPRGTPGGAPAGARGNRGSWRQELAFPFPLGGKQWTELFFNYGGALTFGAGETDFFGELETWPDGTMRWVAGEFDAMSLGGRVLMIAPLWNEYSLEHSKLYINSSPREFIATWDVVRFLEHNQGYAPLGRNFFQVRLSSDGAIEIRYGAVAERDGIAGVFSGDPRRRKPMDSDDTSSLEDLGTAFHMRKKLAEPLPQSSPSGILIGAGIDSGVAKCQTGMIIRPDGRSSYSSCSGYTVAAGNSVDFYISKLNLSLGKEFGWGAGFSGQSVSTRTVSFDNPESAATDLSAARGIVSGNIYEVFHYPVLSKKHAPIFKELYTHVPAKDDLAIVMSDFRIDDLFNHGGGTGQLNVKIEGIGAAGGGPGDAESFGSGRLQTAVGPIYLGPRFQEKPRDGQHAYKNYAFAVGWMAHEFTHRWAAFLQSAATPDPDTLHDGSACHCHWSDWLHTPVVAPVWQLFSETPYPEASNMGGYLYEPRADGAFVRRPGWVPAMGLSALDLHVMGLMSPEEVPDTFLLANSKEVEKDVFTGDKLPIDIAGIVKASGARRPPAASSQREFTLGMYLLYDGRKPRHDKLAQAQGIEKMLVEYFKVATGGRLKLISRP